MILHKLEYISCCHTYTLYAHQRHILVLVTRCVTSAGSTLGKCSPLFRVYSSVHGGEPMTIHGSSSLRRCQARYRPVAWRAVHTFPCCIVNHEVEGSVRYQPHPTMLYRACGECVVYVRRRRGGTAAGLWREWRGCGGTVGELCGGTVWRNCAVELWRNCGGTAAELWRDCAAELCGGTVWRPRAGTGWPAAHMQRPPNQSASSRSCARWWCRSRAMLRLRAEGAPSPGGARGTFPCGVAVCTNSHAM